MSFDKCIGLCNGRHHNREAGPPVCPSVRLSVHSLRSALSQPRRRSRAAVPQDRRLTIAGRPRFHTVLRKILIEMRKTINRDLEMLTRSYLLLVKQDLEFCFSWACPWPRPPRPQRPLAWSFAGRGPFGGAALATSLRAQL